MCLLYIVCYVWLTSQIGPRVRRMSENTRKVLLGIWTLLSVIFLDTLFWVWLVGLSINGPDVEITKTYIFTVASFASIRITALVAGLWLWRSLRG